MNNSSQPEINQQIENDQLETHASSPQPNQKPNWLIIFLSLTSLVSILLATFFGYHYFQKSKVSKSSPTPTLVNSDKSPVSPTVIPTSLEDQLPSQAPNPTDNWQVYRNEDLGIELKYPSDWFINDDDTRIYIAGGQISKETLSTLSHGAPGSFTIITNPHELWSLDEFEINVKQMKPSKDFNGNTYTREEKIIVGDTEVYLSIQFAESDMASVGGYTTTAEFEHGGEMIMFKYPNEYNNLIDNEVYDQIFSSLELF
jgi:hypothetical protein